MPRKRTRRARDLPSIGWREWAALPDLGVDLIKVKVDTGARSSALHAFDLVRFERNGEPWLRFAIHPRQRDDETVVLAEARWVDERQVRSSTGDTTLRPVIETPIVIGDRIWPIQITLVRRDLMGFRMLLGRRSVRRQFLVDPGRSFRLGTPRGPNDEATSPSDVSLRRTDPDPKADPP